MPNNLPSQLKDNWVSNEVVMPVDTNSWASSINKLSEAVPLYAHTGNFYTATYSNNIYNLTPLIFQDSTNNVSVSEYINGMLVSFVCPAVNSANCSVNVNSLGSKIIKNIDNTNLPASFFKQGYLIELLYDSSNQWFKVVNQSVKNSDTATNAIKSTQDRNGDIIDITYIKQIDFNNRAHALKGYSDEGELLTDSEGLADVTSYAHSTFDVSKFTVVGSPTITDDGIASGFSNSAVVVNKTLSGNIEINLKHTYVQKSTSISFGYIINAFDINNNSLFSVVCTYNENSIKLSEGTGVKILTNNTTYDIKITTDLTTYVNLYIDGEQISTKVLSSALTNIDKIYIGNSNSSMTSLNLSGSIDLKQFSITVDGVEVFNGNKTGIDTIKPDDYTVVGAPTISADGIASGFSSSNYVYNQLNISTDKPITFKGKGIVGGTTGAQRIFDTSATRTTSNTVLQTLVFDIDAKKVYFDCYKNNVFTRILNKSLNFNTGSIVEYEVTIGLTTQSYKITVDGVTSNFTTNETLTVQEINNYYASAPTQYYWQGSIDLNSFKIYVDGNLVYQPCLKIPYTESKTGSKIVQSVYRDRVNDMYEQFGYAPYYTLSDTDFTIPQGEIYGMVEKAKEQAKLEMIPDYNNGIDITSTLKTSPYSYTAPANGTIRFYTAHDTDWLINTTSTQDIPNALLYLNAENGTYITSYLVVSKGQTIYNTGAKDGDKAVFYPMKGAN